LSPVPNPNVTIRDLFVAVRQRVSGVKSKYDPDGESRSSQHRDERGVRQ
jgi:hypothetical protein